MIKKLNSNLFINVRPRAFSFVEMLVAITILMFAVTFIMSIVSSNNNEREKVLHYYVAMSIANKLMEDIDNTIRENPYFLKDIKNYDKSYKVLSPDSPFFMTIEDFNLDGKLNDDIAGYASSFDMKKIEDYHYRISASELSGYEGLGEFISKVTITVSWPDGQKQKDYSFSTIFSGIPLVSPASEDEFNQSIGADTINNIKTALNSTASDFKAYAESLGDDYESLYNLGLLSVCVEALKEKTQKIDIEIQNLKSAAAQDLYTKIALAKLYEKKAVMLMQSFNHIKFPASAILKRLKSGNFKIDGFIAANPSRLQKIKANTGLLRKADQPSGTLLTASLINVFSDSIHSAFLIYLTLLSEPSIENKLNLRERQSIFLKIIDLGCAMILNKNENVTVNIGNY
ncbi:MAG TPA: hypothetical protein PK467_19460, partial [Candidatus Wallbacteria bacterium]|nr:hypothetical protein [Candidatus Wallbacteria bacterium]